MPTFPSNRPPSDAAEVGHLRTIKKIAQELESTRKRLTVDWSARVSMQTKVLGEFFA